MSVVFCSLCSLVNLFCSFSLPTEFATYSIVPRGSHPSDFHSITSLNGGVSEVRSTEFGGARWNSAGRWLAYLQTGPASRVLLQYIFSLPNPLYKKVRLTTRSQCSSFPGVHAPSSITRFLVFPIWSTLDSRTLDHTLHIPIVISQRLDCCNGVQ